MNDDQPCHTGVTAKTCGYCVSLAETRNDAPVDNESQLSVTLPTPEFGMPETRAAA